MSRSLNDIIKRSGFGEKMGIKLKQKKKPLSEGYIKAAVGKTSGIKIENYSLKSTINEIINYKRGVGEDGPMSASTLGNTLGNAFKTIWDKIVEIFETIWKFITSQLGAFWDWITGKGKESTKKAIEAKFYEVSGGEVGEKLALPAPAGSTGIGNKPGTPSVMSRTSSDLTNTSRSSINGGSNTNTSGGTTDIINSSRSGNSTTGKTSSKPTGGTPNSSKNKINLPRIFVDEEFCGGFSKTLSAIILSFEREGSNIENATQKLSSVNSFGLIKEIKDGVDGESSMKVKSVLLTLVYGKDENQRLSSKANTDNNTFFNNLKKSVENAEGYAYEDASIDPGEIQPAYSRWKRIEKLIDNICARMDSYKSSAERAISAVIKLAKDVSKAVSDERSSEGLNKEGINEAKTNSAKIIDLATRCGNELKTGLTNLAKDMKKLIGALKPKG